MDRTLGTRPGPGKGDATNWRNRGLKRSGGAVFHRLGDGQEAVPPGGAAPEGGEEGDAVEVFHGPHDTGPL